MHSLYVTRLLLRNNDDDDTSNHGVSTPESHARQGIPQQEPDHHRKHGLHPRLLRPPPLRPRNRHASHSRLKHIQFEAHMITLTRLLRQQRFFLAQFEQTRKAEAKILRGPQEDLESYLGAVEQLRTNLKFFNSKKSFKGSEVIINHTNNLLAKAITKLEDEFRLLLTNYSKPVEPDRLFDCIPHRRRSSTSGRQSDASKADLDKQSEPEKQAEPAVYTLPTLIPPRVIPLLHDLAQQMVDAGHQQQLFRLYRDTRAPVVEQSLRKLGVERLSKDDVQKMQWEVLESKIGNWTHFMRIAVKLLLTVEKQICDQIFEGFETMRTQCFAEVIASSFVMLLSFGEAVAKSKRSSEKLFVTLDMYETMRELHPEMEAIFEGKACTELREASMSLTKRLGQTAMETFCDFEELIENDATKTAVLDGTVHPLTSYVINYVKFLFDYQSTLKQIFREFDPNDPESQLANLTTRIMQALQNNLDGKSKQYKDPALSQLFLMNNIHYIVRSVRRSDAKDMLGEDWVQIHRRVVQQHANQYKRISWAKIAQTLTVQSQNSSGGADSTAGISRNTIKDRFKSFNSQIEELYWRQSQWTVPDSELRESLKLAIIEVLLPAYRSFLKRFGPMLENGKNPTKYIRYTPEQIEEMLNGFFESKSWNDQKR